MRGLWELPVPWVRPGLREQLVLEWLGRWDQLERRARLELREWRGFRD